jgi:L-aminopeptidase/D-esterase-like protein
MNMTSKILIDRTALEQQEQKPVLRVVNGVIQLSNIPEGYTGNLYTYPPRREWQSLPPEERSRIAEESTSTMIAVLSTEITLKEKNT